MSYTPQQERMGAKIIETGMVPDISLRNRIADLVRETVTSPDPAIMEDLKDPSGQGYIYFSAAIQLMFLRHGWSPPGYGPEAMATIKGLIG